MFVGVPLVVSVTWVIESSRPEVFTLPLSERQDLPYISPRAILLLLLLGLSYLRVRRLGRPTLALVWAYGVAAALANAVATVAIQVCWQSAQVGQIRTREDYYYEELRGSSLRVLL